MSTSATGPDESYCQKKGLKTNSHQCFRVLDCDFWSSLTIRKVFFLQRAAGFKLLEVQICLMRQRKLLIDCLNIQHVLMRHESGRHVPTGGLRLTTWNVIKAKYVDDTTFTAAMECWLSTLRMTDWWGHSLSLKIVKDDRTEIQFESSSSILLCECPCFCKAH